MRYRPIDREPHDERLGRFKPDDWEHVSSYPLETLAPDQRPTRVPVVLGVNWYVEFDDPQPDAGSGEHLVARAGVGGGKLYAPRWLWNRSKESDQWPETNPGDNNGTSVRSAGGILRVSGHVSGQDSHADDDHTVRVGYTPDHREGIKRFRWARSVEDVHGVLGNERGDELGAVAYLNSWGRNYPHRVWMPDAVLERLMAEEGEVAVPTDR